MHSPTHPITQLDLVRDDAAARQRRAATYRFVHAERPSRRSPITAIATAMLVVGLAGGAVAATFDTPLRQGYEAGLPDGWYVPGSDEGPAIDPVVKAATVTTNRFVPRSVR